MDFQDFQRIGAFLILYTACIYSILIPNHFSKGFFYAMIGMVSYYEVLPKCFYLNKKYNIAENVCAVGENILKHVIFIYQKLKDTPPPIHIPNKTSDKQTQAPSVEKKQETMGESSTDTLSDKDIK